MLYNAPVVCYHFGIFVCINSAFSKSTNRNSNRASTTFLGNSAMNMPGKNECGLKCIGNVLQIELYVFRFELSSRLPKFHDQLIASPLEAESSCLLCQMLP